MIDYSKIYPYIGQIGKPQYGSQSPQQLAQAELARQYSGLFKDFQDNMKAVLARRGLRYGSSEYDKEIQKFQEGVAAEQQGIGDIMTRQKQDYDEQLRQQAADENQVRNENLYQQTINQQNAWRKSRGMTAGNQPISTKPAPYTGGDIPGKVLPPVARPQETAYATEGSQQQATMAQLQGIAANLENDPQATLAALKAFPYQGEETARLISLAKQKLQQRSVANAL